MLDKLVRNPIVIGIFIGTVAYLYLQWENDKIKQNKDKDKNKKYNSDDTLFIPITLGIITTILAYSYLDNCKSKMSLGSIADLPDLSDNSTQVFRVGNGINMPYDLDLPACFFETY
jgi:hypothetical protein